MTDLIPSPPSQPVAPSAASSPQWGPATKFLAALIAVVLVGSLLVRFQEMIGPLVFAFILAYILNPVAEWLTRQGRLSWPAAVNLLYLVLVILLLGGLTAAGIAIEQQIVGLYGAVVDITADLPTRVEGLLARPVTLGPFTFDLSKPLVFGPFQFDLSTTDLQPLYNQLLEAIRPVISETGTFIGSLASGTATLLGWTLFILIVSYYLLHDLKNLLPSIERLVPGGYTYDVRRLASELGPIWNDFLRGQITVAVLLGLLDGVILTLLGVRYAPVLGLLAAVTTFIPLLGPFVTFVVIVLVALFQPGNWLGLSPGLFVLIVAVAYLIMQQVYDNALYPRILGHTLKLHPIIILVGAIVAASLAGVTGLLLSAPLVATLRLFGRYVHRKLFDLDPWPEAPAEPELPKEAEWPPAWLQKLLPRKKSAH